MITLKGVISNLSFLKCFRKMQCWLAMTSKPHRESILFLDHMQVFRLKLCTIFYKHVVFYSKLSLLESDRPHQLHLFPSYCSIDEMFALARLHDEMCFALSELLDSVLHLRSIEGFSVETGVYFGFRLLDKLYLFL